MGKLFKKPPKPAKPKPPPQIDDAAVASQQRDDERRRMGRSATVLGGLSDMAPTTGAAQLTGTATVLGGTR